jgi:hypothetical protein
MQALVLTQQSMDNGDIQAAWKYHDGTKHSFWSIRNNPHFLDLANRPLPFKIYPTIEPVPLPRDVQRTGVAALSAISESLPSAGEDAVPATMILPCEHPAAVAGAKVENIFSFSKAAGRLLHRPAGCESAHSLFRSSFCRPRPTPSCSRC